MAFIFCGYAFYNLFISCLLIKGISWVKNNLDSRKVMDEKFQNENNFAPDWYDEATGV